MLINWVFALIWMKLNIYLMLEEKSSNIEAKSAKIYILWNSSFSKRHLPCCINSTTRFKKICSLSLFVHFCVALDEGSIFQWNSYLRSFWSKKQKFFLKKYFKTKNSLNDQACLDCCTYIPQLLCRILNFYITFTIDL